MRRATPGALWAAALVLALAASAEEGTKQAAPPAASEAAKPAPECVAGWELMSDAEIAEHRAAMRAAKTREERERLRAEHRAQMSARAAERGMRLHGEGPCGCGGGHMGGMSGMGEEMGHTAGAAHECPMCAERAASAAPAAKEEEPTDHDAHH